MHSKRRLGKVGIAVLCVLGAVIVGGVAVFYHKDQSSGGETVPDTQAFHSSQEEETEQIVLLDDAVYRYTDEIESILFIGTDQSGNEADGEEEYHGAMADMLMVAVINRTREEYAILQLNRDTITDVHLIDENGDGAASADIQLCTAHWYGGNDKLNCENTVRAVSELLGGIPISTYYCLSWEGITTLNSVVGGVTLTIENDFSEVDPTLVMGETVTLTDEQAYLFLRSRYGIDDGENLGRMERHRQYLTAWMQKVRALTVEDATFPAKVYQELDPYAYTNLKGRQINKETQQMLDYSNLGIFTIDGTTAVGSRLGDGIDHMEFYPDEDSKLETLLGLYHLEETDYDPDEYDLEEFEDW